MTPAAAMAANCRNFRRSKPVIMVSYLKIFQCQVDHIFGADTTGTESLYTRFIDRQMTMSRSSGPNGDGTGAGRCPIPRRPLPTIRKSSVAGDVMKVPLVNIGYLYTLVARHAETVC